MTAGVVCPELFFYGRNLGDGPEDRLELRSPAHLVVSCTDPRKREGQVIDAAGNKTGDVLPGEEHPVGRCADAASGFPGEADHGKEMLVQQGFAPSLEMNEA